MRRFIAAFLMAGLGLAAQPAAAESAADFYKGKTVTITSAGGAGGGYGAYAFLLSQHLGTHIPGNPEVIVKYMSGAGGVRAANFVYNAAPKDGTAVLAALQSLTTLQLLKKKGIRYDAAKFSWIGRMVDITSGFLVKPSAAKSLAALKARGRETIVGVTQPGAPNYIMAALTAYCTGAPIKLVSGYKGSRGVAMAYKKSEVEAIAIPLSSLRLSHPDILKDTMVVQSGLARSPHFTSVPLLTETCKGADRLSVVDVFQAQEIMGRAYALPPGVPADRVVAMRGAFAATLRDPEFQAAAAKRRMDLNLKTGVEMQKLVEAHVATETDMVARAKKAVGLK